MSALTDQATALQADVNRVLGDQAAAITKAVSDALAAEQIDETSAQNIMSATQQAIDAFDPPPVVPPTTTSAPAPLIPAQVPVGSSVSTSAGVVSGGTSSSTFSSGTTTS